MAGYYSDASSTHGFVYSEGQFPSLNVPGARVTIAYSINDRGQVAGEYYNGSNNHGFVYSEGQFTSLDVPGAPGTSAYSINDRGQVAGDYYASGDHGFVYSEGQFISFNVPGTMLANISINDRGQVLASWEASPCIHNDYEYMFCTHGVVYSEGQYMTLAAPGALNTEAYSINNSGQVAGDYDGHGFVYSEGQFTSLDPPGARETYAQSINDRGQVAGYYSDASGRHHGFIATPMPRFSLFDAAVLMVVLDSKAKKNDENPGANSEAAKFDNP